MRKITLMIACSLLGSYINLKACICDSSCVNPGNNLLTNGDFEFGDYAFSTAYNLSATAGQGNYGITQNAGTQVAGQWCNNFDHTSGFGNFLWVDGASVQQTIWEQTVVVNTNMDYNFSFYAMNLSVPYSGGINEFVDVYINGILVAGGLSINDADCFWKPICVYWNSANNSYATIEIRNTNTHFMGNDLAFDDISLRTCGVIPPPVCDPFACANTGANLLTNGDFEFGDYGFSSAYSFSPTAGAGNYGITQNAGTQVAGQWCNNVDHSSGTGNFLWVDGAAVQQTIWEQSISVNPNTDYNFSFFAMNLSVPYSGGVNEFVDVFINGALVAGGLSINDADCFWKQLCINWNSANNFYATIEIRNTNTHFMGNDLAFDDITFRQCGVIVIPPVCDPNICANPGIDLLSNGDFEAGNTGFSSAYTFSPTAGDGNYGITQNAGAQVAGQWCNNVDHSSGTGNFLWVDGAAIQQAIWQQTVAVSANTDYNFSFFAMNLSVPYSGGINEFVDVYVNGALVAGNLSINDADCFWKQICVNWNSGNNSSATIEIRNTNTHYMGNDLGFDDITFRACGVVETTPLCDSSCVNPGDDLVLNGNFEAGNTDFSSAYTFSPTAGDGNYGITQNAGTQVAGQWCNNVDHSSGTGNFLWADGASIQQAIWQQTVSVNTNTDYNFSFWAMNLSVPYSGGINEFVDVYVNGALVAGNLSINDADCSWKQLCVSWNSENSSLATIEIRNTNTHYMGNDLAFDDISFRTCGSKTERVTAIKTVATVETKINSYPNPTKGIVNFSTTDNNETITNVKVYDMVGKLITSVDNSAAINLENYIDGVYYAKIQTTKSTYSQKIVVAKD